MSAAQNRHIEDSGFGAGEAEGDGAVALAQTRNDVAKPTQASRISLSQTILDQAAQVAAVDRAGDKTKAILAPMAVRSQPIPEMIGIVGESAHVRSPDVKTMTLVLGRISEPTADLLAGFDESDTNCVARAFEEMSGHQRAARAAADNGDRAGIDLSRWRERSEHGAPNSSHRAKEFDICLLN